MSPSPSPLPPPLPLPLMSLSHLQWDHITCVLHTNITQTHQPHYFCQIKSHTIHHTIQLYHFTPPAPRLAAIHHTLPYRQQVETNDIFSAVPMELLEITDVFFNVSAFDACFLRRWYSTKDDMCRVAGGNSTSCEDIACSDCGSRHEPE